MPIKRDFLIHREYASAFPAKMIIEKERVIFENTNRPHGHGFIDPGLFTPFPKSPLISVIFKEVGVADELGSGVRNLFKYTPVFSKGEMPELFENDIFKCVIPTSPAKATMHAIMHAQRDEKILIFCESPKSREQIQAHIGIKNRDYFRKEILNPLLDSGRLTLPPEAAFVFPD